MIEAYFVEETIFYTPAVKRFGWQLEDGPVRIRKCPFPSEMAQYQYAQAIQLILSYFIDPLDVKLIEIAALLFAFDDKKDDTETNLCRMYLEKLLDEHDDMNNDKSILIHDVALLVSCLDVGETYNPCAFVRMYMESRGLDVKA